MGGARSCVIVESVKRLGDVKNEFRGMLYPERRGMGKNARKKLLRQYGGDVQHTARVVESRQALQAKRIELAGGAELVHLRHLSCLPAAKPRRKGRITAPTNPYEGSTVSEFDNFYFVHCTNGKMNGELKRSAHRLGGFAFSLNGVSGIVLAKDCPIIRSLQVFWG